MDQGMRALLAEFLGSFVLLFAGGLSILASDGDLLISALGFGFALLAALHAFGEVSGGHYNPAVSLAALLDKRISSITMVQYWVAQIAGFLAAGLGLFAASSQDGVASTATVATVNSGRALLLEILLTAVFVAVILMVSRSEQYNGSVFLVISLALIGIYLSAANLSGASINPGRTLGSAIVGNTYADVWVFVVGPFLGGALGWVMYRLVSSGSFGVSSAAEAA